MSRLVGALLACLALPAWAGWQFGGQAIDIAPAKPGVFHHLDASGRNALAVSGGMVAIAWEDNRDGAPRCHVAIGRPPFIREFDFGHADCHEPAITTLDKGRFALIWADEQGLHAALADKLGIKPATRITKGVQGSLAYHPKLGLLASWAQAEGRWQRLYSAKLTMHDDTLKPRKAGPIDSTPVQDNQLYPALAAGNNSFAVTWEDRRKGHTAIYAAWSQNGSAWTAPSPINQGNQAQSNIGRGTGAMRPTLAAFGNKHMALVWLDKRDFLAGYDVYAALSENDGRNFGDNVKAQDSFGDAIAQWHSAVAGNAKGELVIAWDDDRDGNSDIWLTWLTPQGYAENISPPPAHTAASQTDPVVALDEAGNLHLAWIERGQGDSSRIVYLFGKRQP